jgi:catechol 2,3-dioxygenase-like lactoylglutathione lyase family enzyme
MVTNHEVQASLVHVGMTVSDLRASVQFWKDFLGIEPLWTRVFDDEYLAGVTGYPGVSLDAAILELPDGTMLELLEYRDVQGSQIDMGTANPGNVHIAIRVDDIDSAWDRIVAAGGTPRSPTPTLVTSGPNTGARAGYVRDLDGISLELFQSPAVAKEQ